MSDLTSIEKIKLERFFGMRSGYVMDFSNRTFQEFILENTGLDIYYDKYDYESCSKANRLRAFWNKESNYIVGKLISDLLEYWRTQKLITYSEIEPSEQSLFNECSKISERLKQDSPIENIDAIQANTNDKDFSLLAKLIRESIQKNEPESALDRLHTFVTKYIRQLCDKYSIAYDKDIPLHSLFGGYVKYLKKNNIIESTMTERILKSSISVMEAFNDVRNNQSFAHDNPILNYNESILIFNDISNVIRFIESIENKIQRDSAKTEEKNEWDDLPF